MRIHELLLYEARQDGKYVYMCVFSYNAVIVTQNNDGMHISKAWHKMMTLK